MAHYVGISLAAVSRAFRTPHYVWHLAKPRPTPCEGHRPRSLRHACRQHQLTSPLSASTACERRLLATFTRRLACFRINEVHLSAHKAGYAHEDIAGPFGLIVVRAITLHMEACVWAAVDEWRHRISLDGVRPRLSCAVTNPDGCFPPPARSLLKLLNDGRAGTASSSVRHSIGRCRTVRGTPWCPLRCIVVWGKSSIRKKKQSVVEKSLLKENSHDEKCC
jgi:hypothetical protein